MLTRYQWCMTLIAATTILSSTGCLFTPNDRDFVGNYSDPVIFAGATTRPGETVEIQGLNRDGEWETFATAVTSTTPQWNAGNSYFVYTRRVAVPLRYWSTARELHPFRYAEARVRVIAPAGGPLGSDALFTFRHGASSEMNLRDPFLDNLVEYGNDVREVTILAKW